MAVLDIPMFVRDHGWATGVLFSFFALFTPYISLMAVEIRMYSWATFAVMLCFIYAMRIIGTQLATPPARIAEAARGLKCWGGYAAALVDHVLRVQLGVRVPALFRRHVGVP